MSSRLAVVIPVYNHAHYVVRAIRSVLDQTRPVDRLVVIDDGSKDDSVAVIRAMDDPRIELHTQENQNAFNTINRGIRMAAEDCDFIAILNSDDYYHPDRFAKLVPLLEASPDKAVICSAIQVIDENDDPLAEDHVRMQWFNTVWSVADDPGHTVAEWMGLANFPATTSNVIGRADYMAANPFKSYHFNHDYYFLSGAAWRDKIMIHNERLVYYRVHATNTITTDPAPLMRGLLRQHMDLLKDFNGELQADPAMRGRMKLYFRAAFDNLSSLPMGLMMQMFAELLQERSHEQILAMVDGMKEEDWSELNHFPNRHMVNAYHSGLLGKNTQVAEKIDQVQAKLQAIREKCDALEIHRQLTTRILQSRWVALGRVFGACRGLVANEGNGAAAKVEKCRKAIESSRWVKFGRALGLCDLDE